MPDFFEKEKEVPEWATVNTRGIQIERMRRFGDVYLGLVLWKRLKLDEIFEKLQGEGREDVAWADMFCVLAVARLCQPSSELAIAESWYEKTALEDQKLGSFCLSNGSDKSVTLLQTMVH